MKLAAKTSFTTVVGAMLIAGLASLPYLQTAGFGFVNYDDPGHVAENLVVQKGLSRSGLEWAYGLTGPVPDATWFNWPLAWLSHMADVSLFGSWAGGHHLASVALHAVNAALVVAFVRSLGITAAAATFCGVVFAVHPVQVESVAWVSERKTLVSGCFMLLALLVYLTAGRRLAGSGQPSAAMSPAAVLPWTGLGALALLGKPMAVVLPGLLLLLDFWPLRRWAGRDVRRSAGLFVEKLPLFALAFATGLWTIQAQRQAGAVRDLGDIPLAARVANAVCATAEYLGMLVWPVNLAVFYPHPGWRPAWQVLLAAAVLAMISWASWRRRKHEPALLVGWLWFLVTLAPMIGVIQVGNQSLADRYLYLAMLGPLMALAGSRAAPACPAPSHPVQARRQHARQWIAAADAPWAWVTVSVAMVCLPLTWRQVGVWRDSQTLFSHALAAGHDSAVACTQLGLALMEADRPGDALPHLQRALVAQPWNEGAMVNLAAILITKNDPASLEEAERLLSQVRNTERYAKRINVNLGRIAKARGRYPEALAAIDAVLEFPPVKPATLADRGYVLWKLGRLPEALSDLDKAIGLDDQIAAAWLNRGNVLIELGRPKEAERSFARSVEVDPLYAKGWDQLGISRQARGDPAAALEAFNRAVTLDPKHAEAVYNRANLLAETGRVPEAIADYRRAIEIDPDLVSAWFNRAVLQLQRGEIAAAKADFDAFVRLGGTLPPAVIAALSAAGPEPTGPSEPAALEGDE